MKCPVVDDAGHAALREELLSDSEATLRQVQGLLADFSPVQSPDHLAVAPAQLARVFDLDGVRHRDGTHEDREAGPNG